MAAPIVQQDTVPRRVATDLAAIFADPLLDPVDFVVANYGPMAGYGCHKIPAITCASSALRLAYYTVMRDRHGKKDVEQPALTMARQLPAGVTLAEMRRHKTRVGIPSFPTYVLAVPPVPLLQPPLTFALVDGKPREDHLAILFIPPDPARGFVNAHWTFTTVIPDDPIPPAPPLPPFFPVIIMTRAPITDLSPLIYWRALPTPENMPQYTAKAALGQACHCCLSMVCPHEWRFLQNHPNARYVTMIKNAMVEGGFRAEILRTFGDGWNAEHGPQQAMVVTTPESTEWTVREAHGNGTIVNDFLDGPFVVPWPVSLFTRSRRTWYERWWPCAYAHYEVPIAQQDVYIAPYSLRIREYRNRNPTLKWFTQGMVSLFGNALLRVGLKTLLDYVSPTMTKVLTAIPKSSLPGYRSAACTVNMWPSIYFPMYVAPIMDQVITAMPAPMVRSSVLTVCKWSCLYWPIYFAVKIAEARVVRSVFSLAFHGAFDFFFRRWPRFVRSVPPKRPFGFAHPELTLPRSRELISRLAVRDEVTRAAAVDIVRRLENQENWADAISRPAFQAWLETVVNSEGMTIEVKLPTPCWTCGPAREQCKHHECKTCKRRRRAYRVPYLLMKDYGARHEGFVGIYTKDYKLPVVEFKPDVRIVNSRTKQMIKSYSELKKYLKTLAHDPCCRGRNCGPIFMGLVPTCFERGTHTALSAFAVRLASARLHVADPELWDCVFIAAEMLGIEKLEPEAVKDFQSHFRGAKKQKMVDAYQEVLEGWLEQPRAGKMRVKMTGFGKAEKSWNFQYACAGEIVFKEEEKPRFICCPSPTVLERLGRFTHVQTKWLAKKFPHTSHLFYAGCATPEELNMWLNMTLEEIESPISFCDDITAIDSNHSFESFKFHRRVRELQFPWIDAANWIAMTFDGEEELIIRVGEWLLYVMFVNASGVSDTSYKNSYPCIILRLMAFTYAVLYMFYDEPNLPFSDLPKTEFFSHMKQVMYQAFFSAAGDDGIIRSPRYINLQGEFFDVLDPRVNVAYQKFWAKAGFTVKLAVYPEHRWRMATYLAARPVWGGDKYYWAPEPARRMKGLFWQIDSTVHPVAWVRGVATQVLQQGRQVPILSQVCRFVLERVKGPTHKVGLDNPYSVWAGYRTQAEYNDRAVQEFCVDYRLSVEDIKAFEAILASSESHLISIYCHALDRIFQEES